MNPLAIPLVDVLRQLRAAYLQRDSWRLVALSALSRLSLLNQELEMTSRGRYTYRTHIREIERAVDRAYDEEAA